MTHPSDSGHWYDRAGNSVWQVEGAKPGSLVKPDIRHARKLGLLPGATSINKCAHSEGLVRWRVEQGMLAAKTLPAQEGETGEAWLARVFRDSEKESKDAADKGTEIHAAIQAHFQGERYDPQFHEHVTLVAGLILKRCGMQDWRAEQSFGHECGYGGKVDLNCAGWVLDLKSKKRADLDNPAKVLVYDEHPQQLAAYRRGLRRHEAKCANVFISREPATPEAPPLALFIEHPEDGKDGLKRGLRMFDHLLGYWQEKNCYGSSFRKAA